MLFARQSKKALVSCSVSAWVFVLLSSVAVVYVTYDTRKQFNELELLRLEKNSLQIAWRQYLLEESTWGTYSRVERLATKQLNMSMPNTQSIITVESE